MTGRRRASECLWQALCALPLILGLSAVSSPAAARSHHHAASHSAHAARHAGRHVAARHGARRVAYRRSFHPAVYWGSPTDPAKDAELVLDGKTGRVLFARNADAQRHPASLTKMMTLYMLFDSLKKGQLTLNSPIYISPHAAMQKPTKLGLRAGDSLPVDFAIQAAVILSANDIAVAIAEALGGTESHFGELMTQKAHELGMRNTFYHNASGLPDDRQITTASDLGILARHLAYDFPQYFHYFSQPGFTFRGRVHMGHDNLLGRYPGADGIKTGYTNASGFNLVSSVVRGNVNVIGIVMGGYSAHRRDAEMMRLLDWTFGQINQQPQLVARAEVPWQNMAVASNAAPVVAGFQFHSMTTQPQPTQAYSAVMPKGEMDEDSAESQQDQDEIAKIIANAPPKPQVGAMAPMAQAPATPRGSAPSQTPQPTQRPSAPPQIAQGNSRAPTPKPQQTAMLTAPAQANFPQVKAGALSPNIPKVVPAPRDNAVPLSVAALSMPLVTPSPRSSIVGEQAAAKPPAVDAALIQHGWTIQIGAFGDVPTARAQLAAYAVRATDMLGHAERIIVPYTGNDGKTMFRARFGTFAEQEARSICMKLTQRGQACFPATLAH